MPAFLFSREITVIGDGRRGGVWPPRELLGLWIRQVLHKLESCPVHKLSCLIIEAALDGALRLARPSITKFLTRLTCSPRLVRQ
jgi:hypothetical protein